MLKRFGNKFSYVFRSQGDVFLPQVLVLRGIFGDVMDGDHRQHRGGAVPVGNVRSRAAETPVHVHLVRHLDRTHRKCIHACCFNSRLNFDRLYVHFVTLFSGLLQVASFWHPRLIKQERWCDYIVDLAPSHINYVSTSFYMYIYM